MEDVMIVVAAIVSLLVIFGIYVIMVRRKAEVDTLELDTFDKIFEYVKERIVELDKEDYDTTLTSAEFNRAYHRKTRIRDALANCIHGIDSAKIIVIDLIRTIISEEVAPEVVTSLLHLDNSEDFPPVEIQFEILLYTYKKRVGKEALTELIKKYHLDAERDDPKAVYYIKSQDITTIYALEAIALTQTEQVELLSTLVFQQYKGFGIIDTIREMNIDGINIGTSGALIPQIKKQLPDELQGNCSVWIYYKGKQIHLRFLKFKSEDEIRRIVLGLIRYGCKGTLTQNVGKVVSTAPDKSRITALCPPAAESWTVFVRKFGFSGRTVEQLVLHDYVSNGELAVSLLRFLMKGMVTICVSGRQGSGKTTLMNALIGEIDPRYTLRTLEMAFELYLRDTYPERNILATQETPTVSAATLQDTLKKTDGAVSIVGEVATDDVAARMIQMGQVASLFTLFTHHANTAVDLVLALRNSLVNAGGFSDMSTAEKQVTDVVKVDVHLDYTPEGKRYVQRVTEIVALPPGAPYPDYDPDNSKDSLANITREYYQRTTDRKTFYTHDILHYDLESDTYVVDDWFSPDLSAYMYNSMAKNYRDEFRQFSARWSKC